MMETTVETLTLNNIKTVKDLFDYVGDYLLKRNKVNDSYLKALFEREEQFPTGLKLSGDHNVALPHVDAKYVKVNELLIIRLDEPILVHEMCTNNLISTDLFIFMLIKNKDSQVKTLSTLMEKLGDPKIVDELFNSSNNQQIYQLLEG